MIKKRQILTLASIAIISFLAGTMFKMNFIATGGDSSPWNKVWTAISELQSTVETLENRVEILEEQSLPQGFMTAPAYDSGWRNFGAPPDYITFTHNLGTTNVLVYIIGREFGADSIHRLRGLVWYDLDTSQVTLYKGVGTDPRWDRVRVMIWKISEPST